MKQKIFNEITFSALLIVLAVLFLDPFMILMPGSVVYILLGIIIIVFAVLAGLIWREHVLDERDELHRMFASRVGYLFGVGVLVLGIVWQVAFSHADPWIVIALVAMVSGKLTGLFYSRREF